MTPNPIVRLAVTLSHDDPAVQQRARDLLAAITGARLDDADPHNALADGAAALTTAPPTARAAVTVLVQPFEPIRVAVTVAQMDPAGREALGKVLGAVGHRCKWDAEPLAREVGLIDDDARHLLERINIALTSSTAPAEQAARKTKPAKKLGSVRPSAVPGAGFPVVDVDRTGNLTVDTDNQTTVTHGNDHGLDHHHDS